MIRLNLENTVDGSMFCNEEVQKPVNPFSFDWYIINCKCFLVALIYVSTRSKDINTQGHHFTITQIFVLANKVSYTHLDLPHQPESANVSLECRQDYCSIFTSNYAEDQLRIASYWGVPTKYRPGVELNLNKRPRSVGDMYACREDRIFGSISSNWTVDLHFKYWYGMNNGYPPYKLGRCQPSS